jgi:hypothetical protein
MVVPFAPHRAWDLWIRPIVHADPLLKGSGGRVVEANNLQSEAHLPMERISGFMRSHYKPPSGVCSRRIGPTDAMVIAVAVVLNTTQNTTFS